MAVREVIIPERKQSGGFGQALGMTSQGAGLYSMFSGGGAAAAGATTGGGAAASGYSLGLPAVQGVTGGMSSTLPAVSGGTAGGASAAGTTAGGATAAGTTAIAWPVAAAVALAAETYREKKLDDQGKQTPIFTGMRSFTEKMQPIGEGVKTAGGTLANGVSNVGSGTNDALGSMQRRIDSLSNLSTSDILKQGRNALSQLKLSDSMKFDIGRKLDLALSKLKV